MSVGPDGKMRPFVCEIVGNLSFGLYNTIDVEQSITPQTNQEY